MSRTRALYSGTLDLSKAALFFDRMHALKDGLEALQKQHNDDIAEVVAELSDAQSIDPALIRMAFTNERQKRKREARIAKMDSGKAYQLDLLADAAGGSEAIPAAWVQTEGGFDPETGEIIEHGIPKSATVAAAAIKEDSSTGKRSDGDASLSDGAERGDGMASASMHADVSEGVTAGRVPAPANAEMPIPSFLLRTKPPPEPVA